MNRFKDSEHLLRVAAVFLVGITLFLCLRAWFVPKSFGQYGHYRADSIAEVAALPIVHAGHETENSLTRRYRKADSSLPS